MTTLVDNLTPDTPTQAIRHAINESILSLTKDGKTPQEAAGLVYDTARDRTGKELKEGSIR